jgi:predicted amidohydrolase YtcJ
MNKKPSLLVMYSGRIKTDDGWVESIVVQDGVITHVGTDEEILAVIIGDDDDDDDNGGGDVDYDGDDDDDEGSGDGGGFRK